MAVVMVLKVVLSSVGHFGGADCVDAAVGGGGQ